MEVKVSRDAVSSSNEGLVFQLYCLFSCEMYYKIYIFGISNGSSSQKSKKVEN